MTPAELVAMIRSASSTDRALELLAEHDRALVATADEAQAAAVALARQSVAAEISAGLRRLAGQVTPVTAEVGEARADAWQQAATAIDGGRL